jgi:hypothetical protein
MTWTFARFHLTSGMAFSTIGGFPGVVIVKRMLEFQAVDVFLHGCTAALLDNSMAKGAFSRDHLAGAGFMLIIMAAETALGNHVPDIVRIRVPAGLHFREEILLIQQDDIVNGIFDVGLVPRVIRGLLFTVIVNQT